MSGWLARAAEAAKKAANKAYEAAAEYAADDEDSEAVDPRSACALPSKPYSPRTRFAPDVTTRGHITAAHTAVHPIFVNTACRRTIGHFGRGPCVMTNCPQARAVCRLQ